ncbi:hypothetical protein MRX96_024798 [Rhipicephalus microplus]
MLRKSRVKRGFVGTALAVVAVAEAAAFCGCYYYYRRLNRSQEYRYWMYQNFKPGLEGVAASTTSKDNMMRADATAREEAADGTNGAIGEKRKRMKRNSYHYVPGINVGAEHENRNRAAEEEDSMAGETEKDADGNLRCRREKKEVADANAEVEDCVEREAAENWEAGADIGVGYYKKGDGVLQDAQWDELGVDQAEVVHDVDDAEGMCQECAQGNRGEDHVTDNYAVHDETARDTHDYSAEDSAQADGTEITKCNVATTEDGICKASVLTHAEELERHFKGKKHQVKVELVRQEKLKPEENSKKFGGVMEQFDKYFILRRNVIFERARFNTTLQQDGESVEDFVGALHKLSKDCEFGALREEFEHDRLVVGIKDKQLSSRPLLSAPHQLHGPDGKLLPAAGVAQLQLIYRNHATTQDIYVLDQMCTPLLRKPAIKKLQMLTFVNAVADKVNRKEFPAVLQGLGKRCQQCIEARVNRKMPLISSEFPERPWCLASQFLHATELPTKWLPQLPAVFLN